MVEETQAEQFLPLPLTSWPLSRLAVQGRDVAAVLNPLDLFFSTADCIPL